MPLLAVGTQDPAPVYRRPPYDGKPRSFLLVNLDQVNTLYVGDGLTIDNRSEQIPPLGSIVYDGSADVYARSLAAPLMAQQIWGATAWNPGLLADLPMLLQSNTDSNDSSGGAFFGFPQTGRIWGVSLSFTLSTDSSYTAGTITKMTCTVNNANPTVDLATAVLSISAPSATVHAQSERWFPAPIPAPATDQVFLNFTTGAAHLTPTATATVWYTIP